MRSSFLTAFFCMLCVLAAFTSCDKNSDASYTNPRYATIGLLETDSENRFCIVSDKGNKFHVLNTQDLLDNEFTEGDRVYAEMLGETNLEEPFDGDISVIYASKVLTKDIVALTDENSAEIGDDPIDIYALWNSGKYLNLQFFLLTNGARPHYINLVTVDEPKKQENGYVYLELRHNGNGNTLVNSYTGYASFDISKYLDDTTVKGFIIRDRTFRNGEVFLKYDLEREGVNPQTVRTPQQEENNVVTR